MKRFLFSSMALMLSLFSAACSGANEVSRTGQSTGGKVLVAYYSATGSTQRIAAYIAAETDGNLFSIEPVIPYTSADLTWTNSSSRVTREHNDESLRNVELKKTTPDNWDEYDIVFIGYPIWWGIAAWPVNNFLKNNDFTGKTVIPFCTSASSGLGQSAELLSQMAEGGRWLRGQRFRSNVAESDVKEWVDGLDY